MVLTCSFICILLFGCPLCIEDMLSLSKSKSYFVLYVMYITPHLHVVKDFRNFERYFEFFF
jgi:hypothetical protein